MAVHSFRELEFRLVKGNIRVFFLKRYYFDLDAKDLEKIGRFRIGKNSIMFIDVPEKKAENSLRRLINRGFDSLTNSVTGRKTVYIHQNSGIPLLGSQYFGLVDRNTNLIELRPLTGCNLDCIYCSVDEGVSSKKRIDYVVEEQYLVDEFRKLAEYKGCDDIEAHINPQGEPLLYEPLADLVKDLSSIKQVRRISIDTNGTLLSKRLLDRLAQAGLTQLNISLNALDSGVAGRMAGCSYNTGHILGMIRYIMVRVKVVLAPVWVPGINDAEIEAMIGFCRENGIMLGIQNFMHYKHGRSPVKEMSMDSFYSQLRSWERRYKMKLMLSPADHGIVKTRRLEKPFRKMERVRAMVVCPGRLKNEMLASARERVISVRNCGKSSGNVMLTIRRSKHNIFTGSC